MVKIANDGGTLTLSSEFFSNLVGSIVTTCYGVAGMALSGAADSMRAAVGKEDWPEKGVRVYGRGDGLRIELHICVIYGVNIATAVRSISQKVTYAVEQATGLKVTSVEVCVDEMREE